MGRPWRPLSAGSREGQIDAAIDAQASLCGGMELAARSVPPRRGSAGRAGPMFAPCFSTLLYPVTYPQLVGPSARCQRRRRPHSAGPVMTRSGTIGSGSQTRFVRELKQEPSTTRRHTSDAAVDPRTSRLSVREREPRASDDRAANRHRYRSIDRSSNGDGVFATSTAGFTSRTRPVAAAEAPATERSRARTDESRGQNDADIRRLPRRRPRVAGTQRRPYTSKLSGIGFQGNQRGQSLLLDAMARRTCHEAGQLMERNMGAVEEALKSRCPIDSRAWTSLNECRAMYQELLETDEGGMSSVVGSLGRLNSLCSLLQVKGLVPAACSVSATEDEDCDQTG